MAAYEDHSQQIDGIRVIRLREYQPLIEAFRLLRLQTWDGQWPLYHLDSALVDLANVAALGQAVIPTLGEEVADEHRHKLLDLNGQCRPLVLEWASAAQVIRSHQAEISWSTSSHSAPEFIGRAIGVEFEVECKRLSNMIFETVGSAEADQLAAEVVRTTRSIQRCGHVTLDLEANLPTDLLSQIKEAIAASRDNQPFDAMLPCGAHLHGALRAYGGEIVPNVAWDMHVHDYALPNTRTYGAGFTVNDGIANTLIFQLTTPSKVIVDLATQLWEKKFDKAAKQCTGTRGAILVFEWETFEDPELFVDAPIFQHLINQTYAKHKHVARIVMRCNNAPTKANGLISNHAKAYTTQSAVTRFPDAKKFMSLDLSL